VEKAAAAGDARRFAFPRPLRGEARPDFSFSGLKTAVRQAATAIQPLTPQDIADISASFQAAITETLADRVEKSLARFRSEFPDCATPALVVAGGVAANAAIRLSLEEICRQNGFIFVAPPMELCTDNAVMIAWAGLERLRAGLGGAGPAEMAPRPRWPLDQSAAPLIGAGKRGAKA
jgi:N6-L-threonylcarbamoyladenine synthase